MTNTFRLFVLILTLSALLPLPSLGQQTEPTWPQQFQVFQGEPTSFGFAVTQPGLISVSLTTQGQPITATLTGPLPQPLQQSGTGSFVLSYNATAADVQRGALWLVELRAAGSAPAPVARLPIALAPMRATAPVAVAPGAIAAGSITVQHPPANPQAVQVQLQQQASAAQVKLQQIAALPVADTLAAAQTAYAQQLATQQAAQKQALFTQINVSKPITMATRQSPLIPTAIVSKGTTTAADTGIAPAGSSGVQTVATPAISSLSVSHGQPGDPVLITGTGFGANAGEVHFIVNPGMDLVATPIDSWGDTQILTSVPDASGILTYTGVIYVKSNGGQKSILVPFQFDPGIGYAHLTPQYNDPDARVSASNGTFGLMFHEDYNDPFGHKGDDSFYNTLTLKNGWVMDSATVSTGFMSVNVGSGSAGAYVVDSRVGTSSPYVKVHWWIDAFVDWGYSLVVTIKGPKGVPYQ